MPGQAIRSLRSTYNKGISDPRIRASRQAARGLAIKRLLKRGLIARCGYGRYHLTQSGVQTARRLLLSGGAGGNFRPPKK
jgi:Mn-dependent DtxR family transcriptional regulator